MKTWQSIGLLILALVLGTAAVYVWIRRKQNRRGARRNQRQRVYCYLLTFVLAAMAVVSAYIGGTNLADALGNSEDRNLPTVEELGETGESGEAGPVSLSDMDMIPVVNLTLGEFEKMFGSSENLLFLNDSMPSQAQYRLSLTSLYFPNHDKWLSDALDLPLWAKPDEGGAYANADITSVVSLSSMDINQMLEKLGDEPQAWKDAFYKLPLKDRMSEARKVLYSRILRNPVLTEATVDLLLDDPATVNNRAELQRIKKAYVDARNRTKKEVGEDGRGIGVSYWLDFMPGHAGDINYLIIREDQYLNGAFVCALLEYYGDVAIGKKTSIKHWKNNQSGYADMVAPELVDDPAKQESWFSYQLKYFAKQGDGAVLVSWIGFNEADSRPMRFAVTAPSKGKSPAGNPKPVPETTPAETTTASGTHKLQIFYLWDGYGPGTQGYVFPPVVRNLAAGENYYIISPAPPKGCHITDESKKVISGTMPNSDVVWNVYYKSTGGGSRPGGGGGGGGGGTKPKPTDPTKPKPTDPTKPKPTDPTKPKPTDPSNPTNPTNPSPDSHGGKEPDKGAGPSGNAPHGGGDNSTVNGGSGATQNYPSETAKDTDYSQAAAERESKAEETQKAAESQGKGDTTGTSNKVKTDPEVTAGSDTVVEGGKAPERETQGATNTITDTKTTDNGNGTSHTEEKTSNTKQDEVGGTLAEPTAMDGGGSAAPQQAEAAPQAAAQDISPQSAAPAAPAAVSAPDTSSNNSNNGTAENSGGQSTSGSNGSGNSQENSGGSGGNSNDGDGDGEADNGGLSDSSPRDSNGSENNGGTIGAPT